MALWLDVSARPGGGKPLPYVRKEAKLTLMGDKVEGRRLVLLLVFLHL